MLPGRDIIMFISLTELVDNTAVSNDLVVVTIFIFFTCWITACGFLKTHAFRRGFLTSGSLPSVDSVGSKWRRIDALSSSLISLRLAGSSGSSIFPTVVVRVKVLPCLSRMLWHVAFHTLSAIHIHQPNLRLACGILISCCLNNKQVRTNRNRSFRNVRRINIAS